MVGTEKDEYGKHQQGEKRHPKPHEAKTHITPASNARGGCGPVGWRATDDLMPVEIWTPCLEFAGSRRWWSAAGGGERRRDARK